MCNNGTIPLIFEDEININNQVSAYEGMYQGGMVIDGIYYKLTPKHRMVSAKNPDSFGGERQEVPFLVRHPNSIQFTALPNDYLDDVVLKMYQLPKSSSEIFFEVYKHVGKLTSRDLEMMALVAKAIPDRDPRVTAYRIAKYALPKKEQQAFHDWFVGRFGKFTLPTVDHDIHNFVMTDSRQEAYGIMSDFLAVRKLRQLTGLPGGIRGIIFEGIPRDGKSHFVEACLKHYGFTPVLPHEIETCGLENAYCLLPANMTDDEKRETHMAAFNAGILVIENEMNACPALESLHNALAMGFDEHFNPPKKTGYGFIATQNPIYMAGRRATTSPIKHRVMFYEFASYGPREVFQIVHKMFPLLSEEVIRLLTQKKLSFGELLNVVEKGISTKTHILYPLPDVVEQQGPTCKLYALSAVMNWIYQQNPVGMQPPPARKRDRIIDGKKANDSVRQRARKNKKSEAGEVYNPEFLVEIAKSYGFNSACVVKADRKSYIDILKENINAGRAPIVFFDVDMNTGNPIKLGSKQEHAAVCIGYFHNLKGETFFTLLHWGKPWVVNAEELADSANQLSLDREAATFCKIDGMWRERGDRRDVTEGDFDRVLSGKRVETRTGKKGDTFNNKIVIVA